MRKITNIFYFFLLLQSVCVWAQCPTDKKSLEVLDPKESSSIEKVMVSLACDKVLGSVDASNSGLPFVHDKTRCEQVDICQGDAQNKSAVEDASEILKSNIPKAALANALVEEVKKNYEYNILLNNFEEKNKETICPDLKIKKDCENRIRDVLSLVSGSFSDFPNLDRGPDVDILSKFAVQKLYPQQSIAIKKSKQELVRACKAKKINFNRVCENTDKRIAEISDCEKSRNLKGCLDKEQKALASLLDSHKKNKDIFLALEKQLCVPARVVQPLASFPLKPAYATSSILSMSSNSGSAIFEQIGSGDGEASVNEPSGANSPDKSNIVGLDPLQVDVNTASNSHDANQPDEIKGVDSSDGALSEKFSDSFEEFSKNNAQSNVNNSVDTSSAWKNSDFSNRINEIAAEQKKKKEEEEEKRNLEVAQGDNAISGKEDKKKKEEMDALVAQINTLKAKLEEMNTNMDELKSKKIAGAEEKVKVDKEALEREKSILDLKKKLAALEEDKKIREDQNIAQVGENERNRQREEFRQAARVTSNSGFANNNDNQKREQENNRNAFNRSPSSFSEPISPTPGSYSAATASSSGALVLRSAGAQATPDSAIIYMTSGELQKYPYHLNDNASAVEIEKMISGNNGASIILGNTEQIIPVVVNGVVQLDETGKVKYKRVKISLVKNDKEKAQNISRAISSVADLKREEQKKRDLIRYQEMKNSLKLK